MLMVGASHHVVPHIILMAGVLTVRVGDTAGDVRDEEPVGEGDLADHIECVR